MGGAATSKRSKAASSRRTPNEVPIDYPMGLNDMELTQLIDALSRPAAYPVPVESVEVHQTHISAVFLAGGQLA